MKAQRAIDVVEKMPKPVPGLYPLYINGFGPSYGEKRISLGAMGDSFYEYLLKVRVISLRSCHQFAVICL